MGTRNLTAVVLNGEYRVAQYGQWDGYPSGQGATAWKFLKSKKRRAALKRRLLKDVAFITDQQVEEVNRKLGMKGEEWLTEAQEGEEWLTEAQANLFHILCPMFNRDHGAEILKLITEHPSAVLLQNSISFASEPSCEWAYVVDFDKNTFEVYVGHSKTPTTGERFSHLECEKMFKDMGYYPARLLKSYSLDALPKTEKSFVEELDALAYPKEG